MADPAKAAAQKRRLDACRTHMPRVLNCNIVPGYIDRTQPPVSLLARRADLRSEAGDAFAFRPTPVDKAAHLRRDELKEYVERALQLRAERGGMPVVSSPVWGAVGKK